MKAAAHTSGDAAGNMAAPVLRHSCPGRLRLGWAGLRHPDLRTDYLEAWLARAAGLARVRANAAGACLVAEYEERPGVFEDIARALANLPAEAHDPAPEHTAPPVRSALDAAVAVALAAGGRLLPPGPRLGLGAAAAAPLVLSGARSLLARGPRGKTLEMAASLYALSLGDGATVLRVAAMSVLGDALRQATEETPGERLAEALAVKGGAGFTEAGLAEAVERELLARPRPGRLSDRLGDRLALWSLALGAAMHLATGQARRALPVFAVDYSCAVKLSAPLAAWRGLREAERAGAKVRGASALEALARADAVVFTGRALLEPLAGGEGWAFRPGAEQAVSDLRARGVRHISALAEDGRQGVLLALAGGGALDEVRTGLSPREMAEAVRGLHARGCSVAMVGCTDQDALAMLAAEVGILLEAAEGQAQDNAQDNAQGRPGVVLARAAAGIRLLPKHGLRALLAARDAGTGAGTALKASFAAGVAAHSALFVAREARLLSRRNTTLAGRAATASVLLGAWLGAGPRRMRTP